jgi:ABC-type dipeptide/oligopeptide/nickel transport system ATPase component
MDLEQKPVIINPALNKQPLFLIILPPSQIIPLIVIGFFSFLVAGTVGLSDKQFGYLFIWLGGTWMVATGRHPYKITDKMRTPPGKNWVYANIPYISPFPENRPTSIKKIISDDKLVYRAKTLNVMSQSGKKKSYAPFINYQHLVAPIFIEKNGYQVGGLYLQKGSKNQIVFAFRLQPWHTSMTPQQIADMSYKCQTAIQSVLPGESLTFYIDKFSYDLDRQQQLDDTVKNCNSKDIQTLTRSEQGRTRELSKQGLRQNFSYIVTCTYSFDSEGDDIATDFISKAIRSVSKLLSQAAESKDVLQREFLSQTLEDSFNKGFQTWHTILETSWKIQVKPLNHQEIWQWIWYHLNSRNSEVPQIPNYYYWDGNEFEEIINRNEHPLTLLTQGNAGVSTTPLHNDQPDIVSLPGRAQHCALLTMTASSKLQLYPEQQLKHIYEILKDRNIVNTEVIIQLSPVNQQNLSNQLELVAAQANSARLAGSESALGKDIGAELALEESFEAQKLLRRGGSALYISFVVKIYRQTSAELADACLRLHRRFGDCNLVREENIAWALWLDTLPITIDRILQKTSIIEDRRQVIDNQSFYRYLPMVAPHPVDPEGVELIERSGQPIYLDLHKNNTRRALIIGESGSGKSVLAWRFILQALADNIPVIGMDSAIGGNSSFRYALKLVKGSHVDISRETTNLIEPPNLEKYRGEEFKIRLNQWKNSIRNTLTTYIMYGIENPRLEQRVDSFILQAIDIFLADKKIKSRINKALEEGWQSKAWQNIPTLHDWLTFCTKEQLNLKEFEDLDREAINQIRTQITTLLKSPIGDIVGKPSSFNPEVTIKFFTITDLDNERDQVLIAQTIQATCLRLALTYPKSLIVGDEIADLLKKKGFAQMWGRFHAMARKAGISMITISQNIEEIQKSSAAADILKNISFKLIGRITTDGATSLVDALKYPDLIYENASKTFVAEKHTGCSHWLLEISNEFWQTQFFPSDLNLAIVANSSKETELRNRILSKYSSTEEWKALNEYKNQLKNV